MRTLKAAFRLLPIVLGAAVTMAGCSAIFGQRPAQEAQGTLSLVLLVPQYAGAPAAAASAAARIIDPQTDAIKVFLDGQFYEELAFGDLTVVGTPATFFSKRSGAIQVPAKTYHAIRLDLLDAQRNVLTRGEAQGDFAVASGGNVDVDVFCVPVSTIALEMIDEAYTGYVDPNTMVYYDFTLLYGVSYRLDFSGTVKAFLIAENGQVLQPDQAPPSMTFSVPVPEGSSSAVSTGYFGVYSAGGSAYSLTLRKLTPPAAANHLVINELTLQRQGDDTAVEIHNPTAGAVNLTGYKLKVTRKWSDDVWSSSEQATYVVGAAGSLPAGGYMALLGQWSRLDSSALHHLGTTWTIIVGNSWTGYDPSLNMSYVDYGFATVWTPHQNYGLPYGGFRSYSLEPDAHLRSGMYAYQWQGSVWDDGSQQWLSSQMIRVRDAGTGQEWELTPQGSYRHPRWSPDGSRVAYAYAQAGSFDVYTALAAQGLSDRLPIHVTSAVGNEQWPSWSPNGTKIAFASNRNGHFEIFTINAAGTGGETQITTNPQGDDMWPVWSPDGARILFVRGNSGSQYDRDIYVVDVASPSTPTKVSITTSDYWYPEWIDAQSIGCSMSQYSEYWGRRVGMAVEMVLSNGDIREIYSYDFDGASRIRFQRKDPLAVYDPQKVNCVIPRLEPYDNDWYWDNFLRFGWDGQGVFSIALLDPLGVPIDFVEVGGRSIWPPLGAAWDASAGLIVPDGSTVARKIDSGTVFDTDSAVDWESSYGTMGFPNDTSQDQLIWVYAR